MAIIAWNHSKPAHPYQADRASEQLASENRLALRQLGVGRIADMPQFTEQLAQRQLAVDPAHVQAMVGQVQARLSHGGQAAQVFLDQPATGGATDAFHQ